MAANTRKVVSTTSEDEWGSPIPAAPDDEWGAPTPALGLLTRPGSPMTPHPYRGLPDVTNEDLTRWGRKALDYAPAVAAGVGAVLGPPGLLASTGVAALAGGGAELARQGVLAASDSPDAPKTMPEAAWKAGKEGAWQGGMQLAGGLLHKVVANTLGRVFNPERMYQSAVMPSTVKGAPGAKKVVGAGLGESTRPGGPMLNATESGYMKAEALWKDLNTQVEALIAKNPTAPIDPLDVVQRLDVLRTKWSQSPEVLAKIDEAQAEFLKQYMPRGPGSANLSAATAQEKKKQLYKLSVMASGRAYNPMATAPPGITTEANEQIARGLKEELENLFPAIKGLNEREGGVIELRRALSRFVAREGNTRLTSFFGPLATIGAYVGGQAVGGHGAEAGGLMAATWLLRNALEDPAIKSSIAILSRRVGNAIPAGTNKVINLPTAIRGAREMMIDRGGDANAPLPLRSPSAPPLASPAPLGTLTSNVAPPRGSREYAEWMKRKKTVELPAPGPVQ